MGLQPSTDQYYFIYFAFSPAPPGGRINPSPVDPFSLEIVRLFLNYILWIHFRNDHK
jgi:hypothetical protein